MHYEHRQPPLQSGGGAAPSAEAGNAADSSIRLASLAGYRWATACLPALRSLRRRNKVPHSLRRGASHSAVQGEHTHRGSAWQPV